MWLVVAVVTLVVGVATYLTWIAARVDRLHARAAAAYSALDAQSVRRAAAARLWAESHGLADVQDAANAVLDAVPDDREQAENKLTARLRAALGPLVAPAFTPDAGPVDGTDVAPVVEASRRLGLARQVHTDLVRDARAVRRHPLVRLFGFARRHPEPSFFDVNEPTLDGAGDRP